MASSERSVAEGSKLKSAQLLDLVKAHLATDAGKDLQQKIGYTYQINIAPKGSVRESQMQHFHLQMMISWLCPLAQSTLKWLLSGAR
jgi:hypothetical protein